MKSSSSSKKPLLQILLVNSLLITVVLSSTKVSLAKELTEADKDATFLTTVERIASPEAKGLQARIPFPNSAKVEYAKRICKAFEQGSSFEQVAAFMRAVCRKCYGDAALDFFTSTTVAGVATYCPDNLSDLSN